jgi:hypothetical protein
MHQGAAEISRCKGRTQRVELFGFSWEEFRPGSGGTSSRENGARGADMAIILLAWVRGGGLSLGTHTGTAIPAGTQPRGYRLRRTDLRSVSG